MCHHHNVSILQKKLQNSSPNASIAAKVPSNQNQNVSSVSVSEPKMPSNSSNASPSAAITSRNSSGPPKIKGDLPHISSSNSKPASPASKSENESSLPSIHQNPHTSHIPKGQQSVKSVNCNI